MRFEELSGNQYIKGPDTVERYLLGLVQEYFKSSNVASTTSREYIIQKAVKRMKEEISFESIGVLSVTLPDGETKTGSVSFSLEELGGEPLILPKCTAFNVNFGNEANTACEGNDPRLSDARKPTQHQHDIEDVIGLEGILSTLTGKINRVNGLVHDHQNKSIIDMLTYTGSNSMIDLTIIDNIDIQVQTKIDVINKSIQDYRQEISDRVRDINQDIIDIEQDIVAITNLINTSGSNNLIEANKYTDQEIENLRKSYANAFDNFVTKDMLDSALINALSLVGSFTTKLSSIINCVNGIASQANSISFPSDLVSSIANRGQTLNNCQIEILVSFEQNGKKLSYPVPYVTYDSGAVTSTLSAGVSLDSNGQHKLQVMYAAFIEVFPVELVNADITLNLYSKQDVTL